MRIRRFGLLIALTIVAPPLMAGERMIGDDIAKVFEGMTLDGIYSDDSFFSETYFVDGTIRYHDSNGADSGEWSVSGDMFCTFYESQTGACFAVERDGRNCFTFFETIEDANGKLVPLEDWTSRGWSRAQAATCPNAPEAEI
jgi:hypothetical protein